MRRLAALCGRDDFDRDCQNELNLADLTGFSARTGVADITTAIETELAAFAEYEPNPPPPGVYQRVIDKVEVPLISWC